jgi:hypothetical protein
VVRYLRVILAFGLVLSVIPFSAGPVEAHSFGSSAFERTWARTDLPVAQGRVNRTWMWGPSGHTAAFYEPYYDAPGGTRLVQYTDKSRMENNAYRAYAPWDVTNGRLAYELITGRMQLGDSDYQQRQPAQIQIAGDNHPNSPTYATFNTIRGHDPLPPGWTIIQTIDQHGNVGSNSSFGGYGVTARYYVSETDHTVASVFWDFMNSSGQVFENGQYRNARLFENPFFATGFPITEAYWMHVPVAGQWRDVLAQCFERRCLTYTPGNPSGWQVEAGNIGQHYFNWRYGNVPPAPEPSPGEIEYAQNVALLVEVTDHSLDEFFWLLDTANPSYGWYQNFYSLMDLWRTLYPALNSLSPPPGYEHFHERLLEAYIVLAVAADDFETAFVLDSIYWFEQGWEKFEVFLWLYENSFNYWSEELPDFDFETNLSGIKIDPEIPNVDEWDGLFEE